MAVIQIVLDSNLNVVGVNRSPVNPLVKGFNSLSGAYSYGTTNGMYRLGTDAAYVTTIEQSPVLSKEEKVAASVAVQAREVGDTVQFVGLNAATGEVIVRAAALNNVVTPGVTDPAGKPPSLVAVFIDP